MKFIGFKFTNFRSIGSKGVSLFPLKQCNIIVGQNNSGKSNVIVALEIISGYIIDSFNRRYSRRKTPNTLDMRNRNENNIFEFSIFFAANLDNDEEKDLISTFDTDVFYFRFRYDIHLNAQELVDSTFHKFAVNNGVINNKISHFMGKYFNYNLNNYNNINDFLTAFKVRISDIFPKWFVINVLPVYVIPEFRQIREGQEYNFNGENLIKELQNFQNPVIGRDEDRDKFDKIQNFIRKLLRLPDAILEVSTDFKIILKANNVRLPLSSYGTGAHQLVILLTAILSIENSICCIEEPEIHLHPTLQKDFLEFITTQTSNTFLLTTHSPTFINAQNKYNNTANEKIQIFHLHKEDDGATTGGPVENMGHSLAALTDLGVKPSDLLQSNCVIWVEGPSDKIYLNHWIHLINENLLEGVHYSIMFYGGRLLAHLSANRNEVPEELVEILRINQRAVVMIDSDKENDTDSINTTKQRILNECESSESLGWLTDGKEVENYLPPQVINRAIKDKYQLDVNFSCTNFGKFDNALDKAVKDVGRANGVDYANKKVSFSQLFIKHFTEDDFPDELRMQVEKVVKQISVWNK